MEKMVAVGIVWGTTNALMKRGALVAEKRRNRFGEGFAKEIWAFICEWQYWVPFIVNLSASAAFFLFLSEAPISLAVPVTNAVTFAATAVAGWALGEDTAFLHTLVGLAFTVLGIYLCITSP